jgi:hypothetical protein
VQGDEEAPPSAAPSPLDPEEEDPAAEPDRGPEPAPEPDDVPAPPLDGPLAGAPESSASKPASSLLPEGEPFGLPLQAIAPAPPHPRPRVIAIRAKCSEGRMGRLYLVGMGWRSSRTDVL